MSGRLRLGETNQGEEFYIEKCFTKADLPQTQMGGFYLYNFLGMLGVRTLKVPTLKPGSLLKDYDLPRVESLDVT